jgi:hypothetical protein
MLTHQGKVETSNRTADATLFSTIPPVSGNREDEHAIHNIFRSDGTQ